MILCRFLPTCASAARGLSCHHKEPAMIKDTNADLDLDILAEDFQKMNGADHTAGFGFFADFPLDTIRLRDIRLGWVI